MGPGRRAGWRSVGAIDLSVLALLGAAAVATPVLAAPPTIPVIDVRQPSMAAALAELGREAGVDILFDPAAVRNVPARPVRGRMRIEEALAALLSESGPL